MIQWCGRFTRVLMKAYGIDFGTSNSTVAVWNDGQVSVLPLEPEGSSVVRSVIYIHPEKVPLIGQKAIKAYLDDVAAGEPLKLEEKFTGKYIQMPKPMGVSGYRGEMMVPQVIMVEAGNRGRLLQGLKSILTSKAFKGTELFGKDYSLEELLAIYLGSLKEKADKLMGEEIKRVVLGRPVKYVGQADEKLAMERMEKVATAIGFEEVKFELEPTGAALGYGQNVSTPQKILVFDFGGGTLDISIVEFPAGKVLAVVGVPIGGDLINSEIFKARIAKYFGSEVKFGSRGLPWPSFIEQALKNWYSISLLKTKQFLDSLEDLIFIASDQAPIKALRDLVVYNLGFLLYERIDEAKRRLSSDFLARIDMDEQLIHIHEELSRDDFVILIRDLLGRIEDCVNEGLMLANIEAKNIDKVVTTGGSSLIPAARCLLEKIFDREKIVQYDTFSGVATGLAVRAGQVFG